MNHKEIKIRVYLKNNTYTDVYVPNEAYLTKFISLLQTSNDIVVFGDFIFAKSAFIKAEIRR